MLLWAQEIALYHLNRHKEHYYTQNVCCFLFKVFFWSYTNRMGVSLEAQKQHKVLTNKVWYSVEKLSKVDNFLYKFNFYIYFRFI